MSVGINEEIVGKCSKCNGYVTVPRYYMSVNQPVPTCKTCNAQMDVKTKLLIIPMK